LKIGKEGENSPIGRGEREDGGTTETVFFHSLLVGPGLVLFLSLSLLVPFRSVDLVSIIVLLAYLLEGLKRGTSGKEKERDGESEKRVLCAWVSHFSPFSSFASSSPTRPLYRPPVYHASPASSLFLFSSFFRFLSNPL
jgi:hypothetical protein